MAVSIVLKQASERLAWELDLGASVGAGVLSTLVSATVTPRGLATGPALAIADQAVSGALVRLLLDAGAAGEIYRIDVVASDGDGQRHAGSLEVHVQGPDWIAPAGGGAVTPMELAERVGYEELVRLTDELGSGRADSARIGRALADAQAIVDGHVGVRYSLPLAQTPELLRLLIADLAIARLHRTPPEDVTRREKQALDQLQRIADGKLALAGAAPPATQASQDGVMTSAPGRTFTAETLKSF